MTSERTLDTLLENYPEQVQTLARAARAFVFKVFPEAQETVDRSVPVIGYGYGPAYQGLICTLFLSKSGVKLGLPHSAAFPDPDHLLEGAGKVHKYVQIRTAGDLRKANLRRLLKLSSTAARARLE